MRDKVVAAFQSRFGRSPEVVVRAPGRANLLGGHTDYNEGLVLPVALDRAAWVGAARRADRQVRVAALDLDRQATFSLQPIPAAEGDWADYPRSVAWALQERGLELVGLEAVLTSTVPIGSGLSSSAAVEVAFAYAWRQLSGFDLDRRTLALTCQRAENGYVGVNSGILDQMASALGARDRAMLLDCRTLEIEHLPLPAGVAVVVADSGVRRQLASSEYNRRRAECEQAVRILGHHLSGVRALRDVNQEHLERYREDLPEVIYRRARHVVTENGRVERAAEALRAGDVTAVGALMNAAHASLRDDYQVSSPELDCLVEAAWEVQGCYGARLTGAGFGGSMVALVAAGAEKAFEAHVTARYAVAFDRRPTVTVCQVADGVGEIG